MRLDPTGWLSENGDARPDAGDAGIAGRSTGRPSPASSRGGCDE